MCEQNTFGDWKQYSLLDNKWQHDITFNYEEGLTDPLPKNVDETLLQLESDMIDEDHNIYEVKTIIEFIFPDGGRQRFIREGSNYSQ